MINTIEVDSSRCLFCGRQAGENDVIFVTGPQNVSICNVCIKRAADIIAEMGFADELVEKPMDTSVPATECILVVSSASSFVISGIMVGMHFASIVLPVPGAPTKSKLCPPETATSKARFATL